MALLPRLLAGAPLALALLASSACSDALLCTDSTAERGRADANVEVESVYGATGTTAAIVEWRSEPHPQVPDEGDWIFFGYRFVPEDDAPQSIGLQVCAVDADRVALVCTTVYAESAWLQDDGTLIGEDWLAVEHPEQVADVLLIPNDRTEERHDCEADPKDGGGTHPPAPVESGDRL